MLVAKFIKGVFWIYAFFFVLIWPISLYITLTIEHSLFQILWVLTSGLGIVALSSYLTMVYRGDPHFWKVSLLLTLIFYFIAGYLINFSPILTLIGYSVLTFPLLYGMYYLGFNDKQHELFCLIKRANIAKFDEAIAKLKTEESFLKKSPFEKTVQSWYWSMIKFSHL